MLIWLLVGLDFFNFNGSLVIARKAVNKSEWKGNPVLASEASYFKLQGIVKLCHANLAIDWA